MHAIRLAAAHMSGRFRDDVLVWFRRDLRLADNVALATALAEARRVHCVFVFDRDILDQLDDRHDRRLSFIHDSLTELDVALARRGGLAPEVKALTILHGRAAAVIPELAGVLGCSAVYAGRDYEPAALARDTVVAQALEAAGRHLVLLRDQVVFEADEVLTAAGRPYSVYTPYRRAWERRLGECPEVIAERTPHLPPGALQPSRQALAPLAAYGFAPVALAEIGVVAGEAGALAGLASFQPRLRDYATARDFPAQAGTSMLSPHLRFGTLSIRQAVRAALAADGRSWLGELIWREFFFAILAAFPQSATQNFKRAYDRVSWRDPGKEAAADFAAWRAGRTGYPLVDAGMRELLATGRMHNRVRMVVASFLCKHLGIHWQHGERFFAAHLLDYELAANAGNWQWAASTGCDAQPWFRIFNPVTQSQRFDAAGAYLRRWVPELAGLSAPAIHAPWQLPSAQRPADYLAPIVDHAAAREAALARFAVLRGAA